METTTILTREDRDVRWHVAMMPGQRRLLDMEQVGAQLLEQVEQILARIRAKVEHPFRVIKQQFGYAKTRYRGLTKNMQQIVLLFALTYLWKVCTRPVVWQA